MERPTLIAQRPGAAPVSQVSQVRHTPDAYGAAVGQGIESLGGAVAKTGQYAMSAQDHILNRQSQRSRIIAERAAGVAASSLELETQEMANPSHPMHSVYESGGVRRWYESEFDKRYTEKLGELGYEDRLTGEHRDLLSLQLDGVKQRLFKNAAILDNANGQEFRDKGMMSRMDESFGTIDTWDLDTVNAEYDRFINQELPSASGITIEKQKAYLKNKYVDSLYRLFGDNPFVVARSGPNKVRQELYARLGESGRSVISAITDVAEPTKVNVSKMAAGLEIRSQEIGYDPSNVKPLELRNDIQTWMALAAESGEDPNVIRTKAAKWSSNLYVATELNLQRMNADKAGWIEGTTTAEAFAERVGLKDLAPGDQAVLFERAKSAAKQARDLWTSDPSRAAETLSPEVQALSRQVVQAFQDESSDAPRLLEDYRLAVKRKRIETGFDYAGEDTHFPSPMIDYAVDQAKQRPSNLVFGLRPVLGHGAFNQLVSKSIERLGVHPSVPVLAMLSQIGDRELDEKQSRQIQLYDELVALPDDRIKAYRAELETAPELKGNQTGEKAYLRFALNQPIPTKEFTVADRLELFLPPDPNSTSVMNYAVAAANTLGLEGAARENMIASMSDLLVRSAAANRSATNPQAALATAAAGVGSSLVNFGAVPYRNASGVWLLFPTGPLTREGILDPSGPGKGYGHDEFRKGLEAWEVGLVNNIKFMASQERLKSAGAPSVAGLQRFGTRLDRSFSSYNWGLPWTREISPLAVTPALAELAMSQHKAVWDSPVSKDATLKRLAGLQPSADGRFMIGVGNVGSVGTPFSGTATILRGQEVLLDDAGNPAVKVPVDYFGAGADTTRTTDARDFSRWMSGIKDPEKLLRPVEEAQAEWYTTRFNTMLEQGRARGIYPKPKVVDQEAGVMVGSGK